MKYQCLFCNESVENYCKKCHIIYLYKNNNLQEFIIQINSNTRLEYQIGNNYSIIQILDKVYYRLLTKININPVNKNLDEIKKLTIDKMHKFISFI